MAMIELDWYEENRVIDIHAREWLSDYGLHKLGMTSTPEHLPANMSVNMLMAGAEVGLIFPQNTGGVRAVAQMSEGSVTVTYEASKLGAAGNRLSISVLERDGAYEVVEFFDSDIISRQQVESLHQLRPMRMVRPIFDIQEGYDFEQDGPIALPLGQVKLEGGHSGSLPAYNTRQGAFQSAAALEYWDTIAFGIEPNITGYQSAINSHAAWLNQLNADLGEARASFVFAIHEGDTVAMEQIQKHFEYSPTTVGLSMDNSEIINVSDIAHFDGQLARPSQMVLFWAGLHAGTPANEEMTVQRDLLNRLTGLATRRNIRQRESLMNRGFFILDQDVEGVISIVRGVTSFVHTHLTKNIQWTDERTGRVRHAWMKSINQMFTRYAKNHLMDTDEDMTTWRIMVHDKAELFVSQRLLQDHEIGKISVRPNGHKSWETRYDGFIIPMTVDTLDMVTRIGFR